MNGVHGLHTVDCVHKDLLGILPFQLSCAIAPRILAAIGWREKGQKCFREGGGIINSIPVAQMRPHILNP